MNQPEKRRRAQLTQNLFLDVLSEPLSRGIFFFEFMMIAVGALIFQWLEDWSWIDSFYFAVITLTTIGYGDFAPTTPITKLITIFYGLNGVILLLMLFDVVRAVRGWRIDSTGEHDQTSVSG